MKLEANIIMKTGDPYANKICTKRCLYLVAELNANVDVRWAMTPVSAKPTAIKE